MARLAILALDTSTEFLSIALVCQDIVTSGLSSADHLYSSATFYFNHFLASTSSSRKIISSIDQLLLKAGLTLREIDAIAYGAGPGSFTGLRVTAGVAQGLAYAQGIKLIAIDSLLAAAEFARISEVSMISSSKGENCLISIASKSSPVFAFGSLLRECHVESIRQVSVLELAMHPRIFPGPSVSDISFTVLANRDARMGEIYWGVYSFSFTKSAWVVLVPPIVSAPSTVSVKISIDCLAGNGSSEFLKIFGYGESYFCPKAVPHAVAIASLAVRNFLSQKVITPFEAQPIYIRNKVALTKEERLFGIKKS